jgi:DNA-binding NarL/FixJ family response regulator
MNKAQKGWMIGIVEDESKYAEYIKEELSQSTDIEQVQNWRTAEEFWSSRRMKDLDLVLLDIKLPGLNGIELAKLLKIMYPELCIIMLTNIGSDKEIFSAIKVGAVGYILKSELKNINLVISQIMQGGAVISPSIAIRILDTYNNPNKGEVLSPLTKREFQVLENLVTGMPVKKVAAVMGISENTLRNHIRKIYSKMNVKNQVEMMRKAKKMGFY